MDKLGKLKQNSKIINKILDTQNQNLEELLDETILSKKSNRLVT